MPVVCGAMLGWWEQGAFDLVNLVIVVLGSFAGSLSINALWEYVDYRRGLAIDHYEANLLPSSGYSLMRNGRINPHFTRNLGVVLGAISIVCGLLLASFAGWPMLFFAVLSYILALFYAAPPLRYGYRGWGLGEVGVFVSFGLLPVPGGYYALTQQLSLAALAAAIPLGLLSVLIIFNYNILRYRQDWIIRKRTLVVGLGIERALDVSVILIVATYGAFVLAASVGLLPLWSLISLGGLPPALGAYSNIWHTEHTRDDFYNLYTTTINAAIITCALFCVALWINAII